MLIMWLLLTKGKIMVEGTPAYLKERFSFDRFKIVPKDKELLKETLKSMNRAYEKNSRSIYS